MSKHPSLPSCTKAARSLLPKLATVWRSSYHRTPFYVESGGQVSDTGEIYYFPEDMERPVWSVCIDNTRRPLPGLVVHSGKVSSGTVQGGDPAYAVIDSERRWDIHAEPHGYTPSPCGVTCPARHTCTPEGIPGRAGPSTF